MHSHKHTIYDSFSSYINTSYMVYIWFLQLLSGSEPRSTWQYQSHIWILADKPF